MPKRPAAVPEQAVWSPSDNEWIVATSDEQGRYQGLVRYFRPDGSLVCETDHVHGAPHGTGTRFHETGEPSRRMHFRHGQLDGLDVCHRSSGPSTEMVLPPSAAPTVKSYEQVWKEGNIVSRVFRDAAGQPVFADGRPYPARPSAVPERALPVGDEWLVGAVNARGEKLGDWQVYGKDGALLREERYEAGQLVREPKASKTSTTKAKPMGKSAPQKEESLGSVLAPSGSLVVVDFGLMGDWSKKVLASVKETLKAGGGDDDSLGDGTLVALPAVPRTPLAVTGTRNGGEGRWAQQWKHIDVKWGSETIASVEDIGEVVVERARLMIADPDVLPGWVHDETLDGLADVVFWGRDAELLATASGARQLIENQWGFTDLPLAQAKAKYKELGQLVETNGWFVRAEPREHDHHWRLLKAVNDSTAGMGQLNLSGAQLLGFFTGYGDGNFPVQRCLDVQGRTTGFRVILGTDEAIATMDALNG